jgi:MFS family permease
MGAVAGTSKLKSNTFRLVLLTMSASIIYGLPYFRYAYWNNFMDLFNLDVQKMANLQTAYGLLALLSYVPGGYLADRISVKKLLIFSCISTSLTGFYLGTIPGYTMTLIIHGFWGVSTILTFWPAFIKAVRFLANEDEQGKAFGFMESGRGIVNAVSAGIGLTIFGFFLAKSDGKMSITSVIYFYSVLLLIIGILLFVFLKEEKQAGNKKKEAKTEEKQARKNAEIKDRILITVVKMPATWILTGIIFCSYFMNIAFYNFTPYAQNVLKAGPVFAGAVTILAQWVRPFSAAAAGIFGDKIGISKTVFIGMMLMAFGTFGAAVMPVSNPSIAVFIILIILIYISMYAIQANHFALLTECGIDKKYTGTVVGLVSTLGYLPEVVTSQVAAQFMISFRMEKGYALGVAYKSFFFFMVGLFLLGALLAVIWIKKVKAKVPHFIQ